MNTQDGRAASVPDTLEELCGFSTECACGRVHSVELEMASVRRGALDDVVPFARRLAPGGRVLVVADRVTATIAGDEVARLLNAGNFRAATAIVPDGAGARPHADEAGLEFVESALEGVDLAVSVGSGTINDLTKLGSHRRGIPYLSVATAPSMNGYTSAIAAVMIRGVKRTVDCHQPAAVVADLDLLCRAPSHLIASGLGDLESKPTSTADFRLGGWLRGTYHCPAPEGVVFRAEERAAAHAPGIRARAPEAIAALTEALILSGLAMKLAGSSSPASGGEHLISHYWDMRAEEEQRVEGWHGAQVGVATIVCAALYERLRALDPGSIDIERILASRPDRGTIEQAIRTRHGARAEEVATEYFAKHLDDEALAGELTRIQQGWDELWSRLENALRPARRIHEILSAAGAPTTVQELGLTPEHLTAGFLAAREIRGRFTVLDFAADLGVLEALRDDVLRRSGCLG